jgi:hypothetical protein
VFGFSLKEFYFIVLTLENQQLTPKGPRVFFAQNCLQTAPFESKSNSAKLEPILVLPTKRFCS